MTEADHHFLRFHATPDIGLRFVGRLVARLDIECSFVGAAMLRTTQRTDTAGDRRVHVRARASDHAAGERRCVEFMFCVKNQRRMHGVDPRLRRRNTMQQMQEVPADGIVIGLGFNAPAVMRIVIPVQQNRAERGHQAIGNILRAGDVVVFLLGQHRAEHGDAGAHHIHRMRGCGNPFQRGLQVRGQATQTLELDLVRLEFSGCGQLAIHEQIRDLFEL